MLTLENLSVEYTRRGKVIPAVQDFSMTIAPGETVGLVGESGSGKSTVALAILRLIRAQEGRITSGRILFEDQNLLDLSPEAMRDLRGRRIAMIFQDPFTSLNPVLRIRIQLEELLRAHQLDCDPGHLRDCLSEVQLDPDRLLNSYPHQLSGGQRQRVMIAMALLAKPTLILADEPTTALDVLVQKEILDLLFRLQQEHQAGLLFISHNLELVAGHAKRVIVMENGRKVEEADTRALLQNPQQDYTRRLLESVKRVHGLQ